MKMNRYLILLIAVIALSIAASQFFGRRPHQPAPQAVETASERVEAAAGYAIPANAIPSQSEVAASIEKKESTHQEAEKAISQLKTERARRRATMMASAEAEKPVVAAKADEAAAMSEFIDFTSKDISVKPSEEKRKSMKAQGILSY